ncbi:MAG: phage head closure protein [Methyloceanibacter sp.]|uniref:phage head closure protein n=1 Tax=Methyloceanibacter sp. TaxID=1965321 RepID=UPI003D6C9017
MSGPDIGELRRRLTLEQAQRVSDGAGGFTETWVEVATVWAALRPSGGSEAVEADRLAGRVSHEVVLRYRPGVTPAMHFRLGARVFHILAAIDVDERKTWLRCQCEERDL